ncbi:averantin oxidoreductase [Nannizzia gypsea CBS 118893]|uniref:Averantin oxidoreductase n=1 Tax=Arthroderma gypseum (strain ATCC MYA-4604 / CBS 118893) TaxID=535722 RepID=E5QYE6_ARTGP|nr:averantin oxidoreductase [Nannizzia gypsea CBS 118893]EFQ98022.1 averantin oxidoreductase [Nannizzia gypsea CBS 118893]
MPQWLGYHVALAVYNIFLHPLRSYPGPILDSATQLIYSYHMVKGDSAKYIATLHERYGDVVRVGPRELSYISPSANRTIFAGKQNENSVYEKNPVIWLLGSTEPVTNVFFAPLHDNIRYRKLITPALSENALREQEPVIQNLIDGLINGLRNRTGQAQFPDSQGIVNIAAWYNFAVFDILTRLSFGEEQGCLKRGDYDPWLQALYEGLLMSHFVQAAHRLKPYHVILEWCIPSGLSKVHNPKAAEYYPRKLKEYRDKQGNVKPVTTRPEFASFFQEGLSNEELEDNVNILVAAGADSTITTLSSLTYYLTHNRHCYDMLKSEIKSTFQAEHEITLAATRRLDYLGAVIRETLRIHPPVPVGLHRVAPKNGAVIDGRPVPGGTWVSIANLAASRSPKYWRDPERFIPERWLGEDSKFASDNRQAFTPFSIGQRSCIGMTFSNAILRLVIARLFWNFDLEAEPNNIDPHDTPEYAVWEAKPLWLKVSPASSEKV